MNNSKEFLGTEPIGNLLFKLAVPSVIAQIVNMLYNIVDRIRLREVVDCRKRPRECTKVQILVDLGNMQPRHLFFIKSVVQVRTSCEK